MRDLSFIHESLSTLYLENVLVHIGLPLTIALNELLWGYYIEQLAIVRGTMLVPEVCTQFEVSSTPAEYDFYIVYSSPYSSITKETIMPC